MTSMFRRCELYSMVTGWCGEHAATLAPASRARLGEGQDDLADDRLHGLGAGRCRSAAVRAGCAASEEESLNCNRQGAEDSE